MKVNTRIILKNSILLFCLFSQLIFAQQKQGDSIKGIVENQIKEVEITGKRKLVERKVDRLVFNVGNSVLATGGNAVDILKITPGVRVHNDNISMIGKQGMQLMIDDRVVQLSGNDLINFLSSVKSSEIESIEVITNPPAKYSAEGNSGIINIKLKKTKQDSWNASISTGFRQRSYPSFNDGGNFNYRKNKFSFYTSLNYEDDKRRGIEHEQIIYPDQKWNNTFKRRENTKIFSNRTGLDYDLTDKLSIGAQYLGSFNRPNSTHHDQSVIANDNLVTDSLLNSHSTDYKKIASNALNLHTLIKGNTSGQVISVDLDYFGYNNHRSRNFDTQTTLLDLTPTLNGYEAAQNIGLQTIDIYSGKVDVTTPLKWIRLSYGAKIYFSKTDYNNQYFDRTLGNPIFQPDRSDHFNYTENTQAIYLSGMKKFSDQWQAQLGLRVENTQTKGISYNVPPQENESHYLKFFPTAYLMYSPSKNNSYSLNYGRRLSRPRYNELDPFRVYYSTYSYTEGNPLLKPSYTDNIEFVHSYKDRLITSISFSRTTNGIGNPPFFDDETKIQYLKDLNYYTTNTYSLNETYVFNQFKWWESENQLYLYYNLSKINRSINLPNTKGMSFYFSTDNSFVLNKNKNLRAEVDFWYQALQYNDIYKARSSAGLDLGLKYSLFNRNLQIALAVEDLLRTDIDRESTQSDGINYRYSDYGDHRFVRISVIYEFGNHKINVKAKRFGNQEETKRVSY